MTDSYIRGVLASYHSNNLSEDEALSLIQGASADLTEALRDMLAGWKYIRSFHGDLYGVGWDRAQGKAEAALAKVAPTAALAPKE